MAAAPLGSSRLFGGSEATPGALVLPCPYWEALWPQVFYNQSMTAAERPRDCTIEPGDLLYVPSWWWHEVENEPGFNAAVALRGPRSVAAAFSPRADALFATLGSAPDVAVVAGRFLRRKLGFEASFEDAFLRAD